VAMDAAHAPDAVISHCNVGPWHVIMREGRPVGFIDWSLAGPTHPLEELAASGWWNARRGCGDDLAEGDDEQVAAGRSAQLWSFLDGYGMPSDDPAGLVTRMIEFAVGDCAALAEITQITPDSTDSTTLWILAWPTRSAAWMLRHRLMVERAIRGLAPPALRQITSETDQ
jgi:phosphotransferase family enzyme